MEAQHPLHPRRNVRLDTLVRLRWLAAIGQTVAVLVVHYVFDFNLPLTACLLVIACSAALNLVLRLRFRPIQRLEPDRAAWLLAFDIIQLALLLFLTGGVENPFVFLFLGPVLISATALPPRMTLMRGAVRNRARVLPPAAAVGERRAAGAAADLSARRVVLAPGRARGDRRLFLADRRGGAAPDRRARRHRAGAGARAASLAARRARGGGRAR